MDITFKLIKSDTEKMYHYLEVMSPENPFFVPFDEYKFAIWTMTRKAGINAGQYSVGRPDIHKFILMFDDIEAFTYAKLFL